MLDKVRLALRLKGQVFDSEIEGLVAAALADLRIAGIHAYERDPLIERAVILYCKGHFGYIEGGERYIKAYELLRSSLSLSGDYINAPNGSGGGR